MDCNLTGYPYNVLPWHDKVKIKLLSQTEIQNNGVFLRNFEVSKQAAGAWNGDVSLPVC
jgi:hypothetical protein